MDGPLLSDREIHQIEDHTRRDLSRPASDLAAEVIALSRDLRLFRTIVLAPREHPAPTLGVVLNGSRDGKYFCALVRRSTREVLADLKLTRDELEELTLLLGGDRRP